MRVIAFDPGETTGYAIAEVTETPTILNVKFETLDEFSGLMEFNLSCTRLFHGFIDHVIIEDYIIYPNKARSHAGSKVLTARTIGHIEFATMQFGITSITNEHTPITFHTASMAKSRWPNKRLKNHIGRITHLSNHKVDAIRHILTWVERNYSKPIGLVK